MPDNLTPLEYTPGPWSVAPYGGQFEVKDSAKSICSVCSGEANARLIAAAPELLEALESMIAGYQFMLDRYGHAAGDVASARAAVDKATLPSPIESTPPG